jgi:hypothetical protein
LRRPRVAQAGTPPEPGAYHWLQDDPQPPRRRKASRQFVEEPAHGQIDAPGLERVARRAGRAASRTTKAATPTLVPIVLCGHLLPCEAIALCSKADFSFPAEDAD